MQLIIIGKIAAGILLASAAYRPPKEFRTLTGIEQAQLLTDKASDTTVTFRATSCAQHSSLPVCWRLATVSHTNDKFSDLQCYVGYTEGSAYIVFRGVTTVCWSASLLDMLVAVKPLLRPSCASV